MVVAELFLPFQLANLVAQLGRLFVVLAFDGLLELCTTCFQLGEMRSLFLRRSARLLRVGPAWSSRRA